MACIAIALVLRLALGEFVIGGIPFITLFPAVLLASVVGGLRAGLPTLFLGSVMAAYLWLPPTLTFQLTSSSLASLVAFWLFGGVLVLVAEALRRLVRATLAARDRANVLAHEMQHRVRNVIGVVMGISRQTARTATDVEDYRDKLEARILALGRAQELVSATREGVIGLAPLLSKVLEPFGLTRFRISGPEVLVEREFGSSMALLIHELATNALKYGALSVSAGSVGINWTRLDGTVTICWKELNGPDVTEPERAGFGSRLLSSAFPPELGRATVEFAADGVQCIIELSAPEKGSRF
ncbi:sensor histidine kinase [Mesorhizobium sp. NBSH29]|uniref:sensor histidine kinase n=1 Tax=Mesorhizobium sp. NBSH29 TaxID=2654249 RepID=UPI001896A012|nr:HWE histidine kinase domain-containing protein [Mesorhizobium sp. NBSH29]